MNSTRNVETKNYHLTSSCRAIFSWIGERSSSQMMYSLKSLLSWLIFIRSGLMIRVSWAAQSTTIKRTTTMRATRKWKRRHSRKSASLSNLKMLSKACASWVSLLHTWHSLQFSTSLSLREHVRSYSADLTMLFWEFVSQQSFFALQTEILCRLL